jgi:phosphatidylglycerol---prolipoprotein diacylglyceryl transferase
VLPELGSIGPFTFYSFGLMIALAIIMAGVFLAIDLRQRGSDPSLALEMVFAAGLGGFIGARIYYLVENWGDPGLGLFSTSGIVWYGGVAGGVIALVLWAAWRRMPLGFVANVSAAPLALAYAIGRIGCQLAGDGDYGDVTGLPWGMSYPEGTVPTTDIVHPTPIYESLAALVIFWVLWRMRGRLTAPWALFGLYLVLAGAERFLVEFVRATPIVAGGLTAAQIISVGIVVVGAVLLARGWDRRDPAWVGDARAKG